MSPLSYAAHSAGLHDEVASLDIHLHRALAKVAEHHDQGKHPFRQVIADDAYLEASCVKADEYRTWVRTVVLVGIGGSDLGVRALLRTQRFTQGDAAEPAFFAVGDTTDPTVLHELRKTITDWSTVLVIISSKSGNTIEQMASFLVIRQWLVEALPDNFAQHILAITDPVSGTLREMVQKEGYDSLPIPTELGGRYSVLSAIGVFPLALLGLNVRELIRGARDADHDFQAEGAASIAAHMAAHQVAAYAAGMRTLVYMSYSHRLRELGFWFRQLWAESLGKAYSLDGQLVEIGPTPIASLGPTDQHSQLQLYIEGPRDKFVTTVGVTKLPMGDMVVPEQLPDIAGITHLAGLSFTKILDAERHATMQSLASVGRPTAELLLDDLSEHSLGYYLQTLMLATITVAAIWNINPYDQPGVEIGKKMMATALARP
jgi:glucose-6-phosphate isomerase